MMLKSKPLKKFFSSTPRVSFLIDLGVTGLALSAWYFCFYAREKFISSICITYPLQCQIQNLNRLDQLGAVNDYHALADQLSYWTQYGAGVLALLCFFFSKSFSCTLGQTLLLLQSTAINGTLMETVRLVVQRPRPFVYLNPVQHGGAVANYTSFYSGHTSFAALAATAAFLSTLSSSPRTRQAVLILGLVLTLTTGALRVIAGRHFITDVLFGAWVGSIISLAVNSLHHWEPRTRSTP